MMVLLLKKRKNICFTNKIHKRPAIAVNFSFQLGFFFFFQLQPLYTPPSFQIFSLFFSPLPSPPLQFWGQRTSCLLITHFNVDNYLSSNDRYLIYRWLILQHIACGKGQKSNDFCSQKWIYMKHPMQLVAFNFIFSHLGFLSNKHAQNAIIQCLFGNIVIFAVIIEKEFINYNFKTIQLNTVIPLIYQAPSQQIIFSIQLGVLSFLWKSIKGQKFNMILFFYLLFFLCFLSFC